MGIFETINSYKLIFWDFDGVIKESLDVKRASFVRLFENHDPSIIQKIAAHHDLNGGMSRFEKIPIYLEWAGIEKTETNVQDYCEKFASLVFHEVIDCPWVAGIEHALKNDFVKVPSILVTATPHNEIEKILDRLEIRDFFHGIYGAPNSKKLSIQYSLNDLKVKSNEALMFGDSELDYDAASSNGVEFILRRTPFNGDFCSRFKGQIIRDFDVS